MRDGTWIDQNINKLLWVLGVMWVLLTLWVLCCCSAPRVMRFVERGSFQWERLDSVLDAHSLPPLDGWRNVGLVTIDRKVVGQYTYVQSLGNKEVGECIYTIETRDSVFLFVHRIRVKQQ